MSGLEGVVRPFQNDGADATGFAKSGGKGTPSISRIIGYPGGTKTFGYTFDSTETYLMGNRHRERAPKFASLQAGLANPTS